MAKDKPAPKKKAPKAPAKERRQKVDTTVSLFPLTLEEAVDKLLKSGPIGGGDPSGGRSAPVDRKPE